MSEKCTQFLKTKFLNCHPPPPQIMLQQLGIIPKISTGPTRKTRARPSFLPIASRKPKTSKKDLESECDRLNDIVKTRDRLISELTNEIVREQERRFSLNEQFETLYQ